MVQSFGLEGSGIECIIPPLVGNMVIELVYQHLYTFGMELQ